MAVTNLRGSPADSALEDNDEESQSRSLQEPRVGMRCALEQVFQIPASAQVNNELISGSRVPSTCVWVRLALDSDRLADSVRVGRSRL